MELGNKGVKPYVLSAGGVFLLIRLLAKPYSLTQGNQ